MATTKKLYATRDFNDAGTEKSFTLGEDITNEEGVDNYVAAGLASEDRSGTLDVKSSAPKDLGASSI